ncbi:MAG: TonB-dependent receptor [Sphingomonas sp.]
MFGGHRGRMPARRALGGPLAIVAFWGSSAAAQASQDPPPSEPGKQPDATQIVVIGERGSAVTDIAPIATLDADAVAASGATTMTELLRTIRGTTQSADGQEPIFLLNSQRVSGYQDIGSLPPEAIQKVEVLPEQAALRFGFPPTRRVVNFITKRRFRQIEVRGSAGTTTRAGSTTQKANLGLTRLHDDARLTLTLEVRHTSPLLQADRDIAPDPAVPFDAIGNVVGLNGGEIDPALSAAVGHAVTIARVPEAPADRTTIAGFAAGAAGPRLFDLGSYHALAPGNDAVKGEVVLANRIGKTLAGSISLSAEQSRDRTLWGPADVILTVPGTNPYSPFASPVLLYRYLTEAPLLRHRETVTTLHAGATLRGAIAGWRWDFTGALDQKQTDSRSERGIDTGVANAAIAAGANSFAPLDPALLTNRLIDRSKQRTRTAEFKMVVTNTPIRLPAGPVAVTATVEAGQSSADSSTRGPRPFDLDLGRGRIEGGIAIDVPLASRREGALGFIGDLSVSASFNARQVGGFGSLTDATYGIAWGPIEGVQLLATVKRSAAAPDMTAQSTPEVRSPNVPVFDFGAGRTELVTLIQGGNPGLAAEHRLVRSLAINLKPFAKSALRVSVGYEATTIRDQTGTVYALTPQTESILPDLFARDAAGRLVSVEYRPINFSRERQRALSLNLNTSGKIGKGTPPIPGAKPAPGAKVPISYYGGTGPGIKFSDRLALRPGAPELDVLHGDTITGWGMPSVFGYAYGGFNHLGNGASFDFWYGGPTRVRAPDPASDLRFSSIFKLNIAAFVSIHQLLPHTEWTRHLQLRLEVQNLGDAHQRVLDGFGRVPYRFQPDLLDPIGRTVTLSLRKLF